MTRVPPFVQADRFNLLLPAVSQDFESAMAMSNSMAFISQFGEYNPGGGKDEVLKYLDESKKQVVIVRDCLRTILQVVNV